MAYSNSNIMSQSAAYGKGASGDCPVSSFGAALEPCGYLRSPCRVWIAGDSVLVPAAGSESLILQVQDPFAGDLVQMVATNAAGAPTDGCVIDAIAVGTRPQQLNLGNISHSRIFAPDNELNPLNLDVTGPGKEIRINFMNPTAAAQTMFTTIFGRTITG